MLNRKVQQNNKKAFTLTEVIVAMFIFVLIVSGSTVAFGKMFKAYKENKALQQNLDNAQYSLNLMAKSIRTSSVVDISVDGQRLVIFDYSQMNCIKYEFIDNKLTKNVNGATGISSCETVPFDAGNDEEIVTGNVSGKFIANKSDSNNVGLVTIVLSMQNGSSTANIQTSVSLRDYNISGISLN